MTKIGFIGLGIMGKPMVRNLLKAGHELITYSAVRSNVGEVVKGDAKVTSSSKNAAAQCSLIIIMLPNFPHIESMILGTSGALEGAAPGAVLVDMSSIAPLASREICREREKKGVKMIDAPMSGGEPKTIDNTPFIMAGGEKEVLEQVYDVLMTTGTSTVHCGDIGAGGTIKLANQVIVAPNIAAVSEAFMLNTGVGVDPLKVFDVVKGGPVGSTVMDAEVPMITGGNFAPGFKVDLHIKDLGNALETGHGVDAPLLLTTQVMEIMRNLYADGLGENDRSTTARYYEKLTGTEIRKQERFQ